MIFKNMESRLTAWVFFLFFTLCAASYALVQQAYLVLALMLLLAIWQLYMLIGYQRKTGHELRQFVESVRYRDFSRHFDVKHAPSELQPLRQGFNQINTAFRDMSKEKETQYHYLQKILEMIDTGILSYKLADGEVVWMNESLKKLLQLPYLRGIQSLEKRDAPLYQDIVALQAGQNKITTAQLDKHKLRLLLSATVFQTEGVHYKLIAFQNVHEALDETESRAWQKLLSVMTHEIMNSVAPISSLADTLKNRLHEIDFQLATPEDVEDLEIGISTIKRRSEGLLKFAETYRNLNKITSLSLQEISIKETFANLKRLMQPTLKQKNIDLEIKLSPPELSLQADANLLDQVLINLLINAMDAVKEREAPKIILAAQRNAEEKIIIRVTDNGTGMSKEVQEQIFIPFFSTKKQGSGIGLSLCKQIIMLHRGSIQVQSEEGVGTSFVLRFG